MNSDHGLDLNGGAQVCQAFGVRCTGGDSLRREKQYVDR